MAPGAETTQRTTRDQGDDIWGRIPPDERLEILASAQAKGVQASLLLLLMSFSAALGLKAPWIFFGSLLLLPFSFQIMSAKAWRILKARPMLEYAAARSTSLLYANQAGARHLVPGLMFRAELEPNLMGDSIEEPEDDLLEKPAAKPVWVSVYPDTMVVVAEGPAGARLELAHSLFKNFSLSEEGFDEGEESSTKRLSIEVESQPGKVSRWILSSRHPATLLACARRTNSYIARHRQQKEEQERRALEAKQRNQARLEQQPPKSSKIAFEGSSASAPA